MESDGISWGYTSPLVISDIAIKNVDFPIENGDFPIEMVDLPKLKMVMFHIFLYVNQRRNPSPYLCWISNILKILGHFNW